MRVIKSCRRAIKSVVFGDTLLPQEFTVGLVNPQAEIVVWLHGMGEARDVTCRQSTACSSPFVICISFDKGQTPSEKELGCLALKFCEREGQKQVLGEIGLRLSTKISPTSAGLFFFEARNVTNYCLPKARLWAHYLLQSYSLWRKFNTSGMTMSFLERRAAIVSFIRPHPVSLVSASDDQGGNVFPMNLMGELGHGRFAFGLKESRTAAPLVERTGRIAVSSIPLPQSRLVFQLAANHFKQSVEWNQLPFETKMSAKFQIPVPTFALRVREIEVEEIHRIGSHIFFVARIVSDERFREGEELCVVHGFYQVWRLKGNSPELEASLGADMINKRGVSPS